MNGLIYFQLQLKDYMMKTSCWLGWGGFTLMLFAGVPSLMDPHPSQQHAGPQNGVWQLQQEVARSYSLWSPTIKVTVLGRSNTLSNAGSLPPKLTPLWLTLTILDTEPGTASGSCRPFQTSWTLCTPSRTRTTGIWKARPIYKRSYLFLIPIEQAVS